jgi:DNA-binding CsgD family transcriptional regulator
MYQPTVLSMDGNSLYSSVMDNRGSLSRLTEREKLCLRQWLQHKSAKEIAAELSISHHAVEKRLKMARTKLGATSSLEAARMLRDAEGYDQSGPHSPDLASVAVPIHSAFTRFTALGVGIMIIVAAVALGLFLQPVTTSRAANHQPLAGNGQPLLTPGSVPKPGTETALRSLVAGLASGSPDYGKLSPQFAEVVRRDLPMTHPMFSAMGQLKSANFLGRGQMGDDFYNLVFAKGGVIMSAALDADGRMAGGILRPMEKAGGEGSAPNVGTEAAMRTLVAGLASGSPDYSKLSPQFAQVVRGDLPMTHSLFSSMGALKSVTFLRRGEMGDDVYNLVFANGGMIMSAALDANGRMTGGMFQPVAPPGR